MGVVGHRGGPLPSAAGFLKSRTPVELKRRVETLIRTIERELEDVLRKDKDKRKAAFGAKRKTAPEGSSGAKKKKAK